MKKMIIKKNFKWQKPVITRSILFLSLMGVLLLMTACEKTEQSVELVGGEISSSDFEDGVEVYIEEGYAITEAPHSIWLVSDEDIAEEILSFCGSVKQYRQVEKSSDIMYGEAGDFEYLPRIYLVTDEICYSVEILNWENYSGDEWSQFPIRQERSGEPTMHVFRLDLSLMPENKTPYSFAKESFASDTMNSESGVGWFSTMSQESMDELLNLLRSIGTENAEIVEEIE